jgi:hypothetical protein
MLKIKDARLQNKVEVGEKQIRIQQVAQKEVPYTIVMNKYDGSISSNFQSSKVISDDEVIDPESPEESPIRRQQNK